MGIPELELPVNLIGAGDDGKECGKTVMGYFNPTEIAAYHDGYYPETGIFIYLKGGQPVQIAMTLEDYRQKLKEYWIEVSRQQQTIKQKLKIIN
ncbi:MAG: hypothetical protein JWR05_3491 [Mucilaginibacter sp.]|nr:hypothetical protein [Mucilaginibacter sp.]